MKKLLALILLSPLLIAECRNEPKYFPKLDYYMDRLVGDASCVMADIINDDAMIAGYWIEDKTRTMFIAINNIRVGRDIDIEKYGYTELYKSNLLDRVEYIKKIKFVKRFSYDGSIQPQIELKLNEMYGNSTGSSTKSKERKQDNSSSQSSDTNSKSIDLKCDYKNLDEEYYFYNYLITLNTPSMVKIHFQAIKYDFDGETYFHLNHEDKEYKMKSNINTYSWVTNNSVIYTLNRETINLKSDSIGLDHEYSCEIIDDLEEQKLFYLLEFKNFNKDKLEAKLKKNKI
ncbi:hypothetical protein N9H95_03220 [Gammaproteobacteria bacterium]|nr:hypothetical protein [Gammaproteobacteria bacterium]